MIGNIISKTFLSVSNDRFYLQKFANERLYLGCWYAVSVFESSRDRRFGVHTDVAQSCSKEVGICDRSL